MSSKLETFPLKADLWGVVVAEAFDQLEQLSHRPHHMVRAMLWMVAQEAVGGRAGGDRNLGPVSCRRGRHDIARFVADVHACLRQHGCPRGGVLEAFGLVQRSKRSGSLGQNLV